MSEATIEYKNSPNESTAYAVSEGQKTKVQMVATPAGDLELAESPNVDTGYIVIDGKKHKCALVAEVAGELKLPTSATDDTGYVIAQDGRQHKVKLVANITGGGGGTTINNQDITVTENGVYTADTGYTGLGTVKVQVPNPSTGTLSIVENGSYDVTEYATAEVNVPTSGGATTKFGVSIDNLLGDVDANGVYVKPTEPFVFDGTGIKGISVNDTLAYAFYQNRGLIKLLLPDLILNNNINAFISMAQGAVNLVETNLGNSQECYGSFLFQRAFKGCSSLTTVVGMNNWTRIYGDYACEGMFSGCRSITSTGLNNLTIIESNSACMNMYEGCTGLTSTGLNNLTTINGNSACQYMFSDATNITDTGLQSLETITGVGTCQYMFKKNTSLVRADFPALTVVSNSKALGSASYNGMFVDCTNLAEIHFRADAQATIEGLSGYASKFGAPSTCTIYFDLIGTITVGGVAYSRNEPNSIRVDGTKTFVAWKDASNNIVYTNATAEPAVDTPVYSDAGTTQVGTVSGVA